jgi:hypothetical protein
MAERHPVRLPGRALAAWRVRPLHEWCMVKDGRGGEPDRLHRKPDLVGLANALMQIAIRKVALRRQTMTQQNSWKQSNAVWGILLIAGGLLFLLQNLGIFSGLAALVWVALFAAAGLFFLYLFLKDRTSSWWAAIPGCTLLGLAATVFFGEVGPRFLEPVSGPLFLFSIGLGFVLVYLATPQNWWAVIPAGVMTTLAVVAGVDAFRLRWIDSGSLFFIGLGLTFLLLGVLPANGEKGLRWAFIPGVVLLVMGILIGTPLVAAINYLWPLVLIVGGALLIWRNLTSKASE